MLRRMCVILAVILFAPYTVHALENRYDVPVGDSPAWGPEKAPITVIEFVDYQWPHCNGVGPTVKKLLDTYQGKIRFIIKQAPYRYRDFSYIAAEATLAAKEQNKFWEMHWLLHDKFPRLDKESLKEYAKELDLDLERFTNDLEKMSHLKVIERDLQLAKDLDLYSTPAFFINGIKALGNRPYENFVSIIDSELEATLKDSR